jgi:tetratricopeptide (TPR) repeat protein
MQMMTAASRRLLLVLMTAPLLAAAGPREDFKAAVEAAKKSPGDMALRAKAVAAARRLRPAPALPEAALRLDGRAQFAFKDAKSEADFAAAAAEYEKAALEAPWHADYAFNACVAYEKAGRHADALRHCRFYASVTKDKAEAAELQKRIGGLEFAAEKQSKAAQALAARKLRIVCRSSSEADADFERSFEVDGAKAVSWDRTFYKDAFIRKMAGHGVTVERNQYTRFDYEALPGDPDHFVHTPSAAAGGLRSHAKLMDGGSWVKLWPEDGKHSESHPYGTCPPGR